MYRNRIILILIISFCISGLSAQVPDDFVNLDTDEIMGLSVKKQRTFTKESLFGYMNGGAELYLEYGFDRVVVYDLIYQGKDIKVEAFKMNGIPEAFGIFSVSYFRCSVSDSITTHFCQSDYQVQFHKGNYYVNVINGDGSESGLRISRKISEQLIKQIPDEGLKISNYIPEDQLPSGIKRVILVNGDISGGNNAHGYLRFLEGLTDYLALIVEGETKSMVCLRFNSKEMIKKFFIMLGEENLPETMKQISIANGVIFLNSKSDIIIRIDTR